MHEVTKNKHESLKSRILLQHGKRYTVKNRENSRLKLWKLSYYHLCKIYHTFLLIKQLKTTNNSKARIFLLVDLGEFFSDLGSGVRLKINKKALKKTS